MPRASVSSIVQAETGAGLEPPRVREAADLVGTLVHRLLQAAARRQLSEDEARRLATRLLGPEELAETSDLAGLVEQAVAAFASLRAREDIGFLLRGQCSFEVPFSVRMPPPLSVILRGAIDCLVRHPDGRITVVEFKTGRRRSQHQVQVELYVTAAKRLFPDALIDGVVVYP